MWEPYVKQTALGWLAWIKDGDQTRAVRNTGLSHHVITISDYYVTRWGAAKRAHRAAKRANIRDYSQMEKV